MPSRIKGRTGCKSHLVHNTTKHRLNSHHKKRRKNHRSTSNHRSVLSFAHQTPAPNPVPSHYARTHAIKLLRELMKPAKNVSFTSISSAQMERIRFTLASHPDLIHIRSKSQSTLLHHATRSSSYELTQFLMKHGANPFAIDRQHNTPFDYARNLPVALLLMGLSDKQVNKRLEDTHFSWHYTDKQQIFSRSTGIFFPVFLDEPELLARLLNVRSHSPSILTDLLRICRSTTVAQLLLDAGATKHHGKGILHHLAMNDKADVLQFLLEHGFDPNEKYDVWGDITPLDQIFIYCLDCRLSFRSAEVLVKFGGKCQESSRYDFGMVVYSNAVKLAYEMCKRKMFPVDREYRTIFDDGTKSLRMLEILVDYFGVDQHLVVRSFEEALELRHPKHWAIVEKFYYLLDNEMVKRQRESWNWQTRLMFERRMERISKTIIGAICESTILRSDCATLVALYLILLR